MIVVIIIIIIIIVITLIFLIMHSQEKKDKLKMDGNMPKLSPQDFELKRKDLTWFAAGVGIGN